MDQAESILESSSNDYSSFLTSPDQLTEPSAPNPYINDDDNVPTLTDCLYVTNLNQDTRESDLYSLFMRHGVVTEIRIIYDEETGQSRGFGFVSYSDIDDALEAFCHCDGKILNGRKLVITFSDGRHKDFMGIGAPEHLRQTWEENYGFTQAELERLLEEEEVKDNSTLSSNGLEHVRCLNDRIRRRRQSIATMTNNNSLSFGKDDFV
ncbi:hypothetical protein RDWZM_004903 [Blomia tropicalis]|uniref:RRM domain-containing protein n=1 Tax=Blomia tropicalis TaxID=40697 RepID=A0A9Q0M4L3_BLOTA|nr:hypothetical protein RDWZM_004903 [Blomia tropicalis]